MTFDSEHVARRNTDSNIQVNYTIVMDGADGPSSTDDNLKLVVKPNPVFTAIHEEDAEYTVNSKTTIRILVTFYYVSKCCDALGDYDPLIRICRG